MAILADMSSWLGSVFFALLCGVVGFGAGYFIRGKKQF
jgi:hypothetical protein